MLYIVYILHSKVHKLSFQLHTQALKHEVSDSVKLQLVFICCFTPTPDHTWTRQTFFDVTMVNRQRPSLFVLVCVCGGGCLTVCNVQ